MMNLNLHADGMNDYSSNLEIDFQISVMLIKMDHSLTEQEKLEKIKILKKECDIKVKKANTSLF